MAETETDKEQKTEHPTGKRLREARDRGQLAISREVGNWTILTASLIVLVWLGPRMSEKLLGGLRVFLEMPHAINLEGRGMQTALAGVMANVGVASALCFGILLFAAIAGTMMQTGFYFNTSRLEFDPQTPFPYTRF